jgi:tetratricopeptide (TPR) repeat protein
VFRVHDRVSGDEVALKVLFPRGEEQGHVLERLRRELRILRELNHPGIVRVRDVGAQGGLLYLAMDLLDGETLYERLSRDGPLPEPEALRIADGMLDALAAAHRAGIIHRDIKPQNVFLEGGQRVVLLDFGLARKEGDARLTETGSALGTPEYAAPEQARGDGDVGPAADVYSAGIVLWEMLAGAPPFRESTPLATLEAQTLRPLPAPKARMPEAPAWLRDLVAWMLEKRPERRPASAEPVARVLRSRRRAPLLRRWERGARQRLLGSRGRRARWTAGAALAAACLLALAVYAFRSPGEVREQGRTVEVVNPLGQTVHRASLPRRVTEVLALDAEAALPREHLVLMGYDRERRRPFPADYPVGLALFDAWTGDVEPFVFEPGETWARGLHQSRERFDAVFYGHDLARTPWIGEDGDRILLAAYRHEKHYPTQIIGFEANGDVRYVVDHPGSTRIPPAVVGEERGDEALVVFGAQNNLLGQRRVVFALSSPAVQGGGPVAVPPERETGEGRPAYYTFLSVSSMAGGAVQVEGTAVVFATNDGRRVRLDARTGVPLDREERGGQSREAWRASQERLVELLERAVRAERNRDVEAMTRLGQALSGFAEPGEARSSAQAGVALARAAELYRIGGRTARALERVERAIEVEPGIPGHHRLLVDLLRREGRWAEARARVLSADSDAQAMPEVLRDLFLSALIQGDLDTARELAPDVQGGNRMPLTYGRYCKALLALHEGRPQEALLILEEHGYRASLPGFAFLRALAYASLEEPRPQEARRALAVADEGRGGGHVLPIVPLRARIAAIDGGVGPSRSEIEAALARQRRAARSDPIARYFLDWARRLVQPGS